MKFLNLLGNDLKRAVFSWRFLFSAIGIGICMMINVAYEIPSYSILGDKLMLLHAIGNYGGYGLIAGFVLPCFPFAMSFAKEWTDHSYLFYTARVGATRYILSKLLVSAISGFLVLLLGIGLTVTCTHFVTPDFSLWDSTNGLSSTYFYSKFFVTGHTFLGYFLICINYALSWGIIVPFMAVMFSTYVPNPLATVAAPLIFNFSFVQASTFLFDRDGTFFFNGTFLERIGNPYMYLGYFDQGTIWEVFGDRAIMNGVVCLIFGTLAILKARRRIMNG